MQVGLIFVYKLLFLYMVIADGLVAVGEKIVGIFCADKNWRPEPIAQILGSKRCGCESLISSNTKY